MAAQAWAHINASSWRFDMIGSAPDPLRYRRYRKRIARWEKQPCRFASGRLGRPPMAQPEGGAEERNPEKERVDAEPPGQRDDPSAGLHEQNDAEQDRDDAAEHQEPLAIDADHRDPGGNQRDPGNHGPDGNKIDDRDQGLDWPEEHDRGDDQVENAFKHQRAGGAVVTRRPQGRDQREDAVDECVGAKQQHKRCRGDPRPYESDHGEDDRKHTAQRQRPPITDQDLRHLVSLLPDPCCRPVRPLGSRSAPISPDCRATRERSRREWRPQPLSRNCSASSLSCSTSRASSSTAPGSSFFALSISFWPDLSPSTSLSSPSSAISWARSRFSAIATSCV